MKKAVQYLLQLLLPVLLLQLQANDLLLQAAQDFPLWTLSFSHLLQLHHESGQLVASGGRNTVLNTYRKNKYSTVVNILLMRACLHKRGHFVFLCSFLKLGVQAELILCKSLLQTLLTSA